MGWRARLSEREGRGHESQFDAHCAASVRALPPSDPRPLPLSCAHPMIRAIAARKKSRSKCCSIGSQRSSGAASRLTLKSGGARDEAAADSPAPARDRKSVV